MGCRRARLDSLFGGPQLERHTAHGDGDRIDVDPPQALPHDLGRVDAQRPEVVGGSEEERAAAHGGVAHGGGSVRTDGQLGEPTGDASRGVVNAITVAPVGVERPLVDPAQVGGTNRTGNVEARRFRERVDRGQPRMSRSTRSRPHDRGRRVSGRNRVIDPGEPGRHAGQRATSAIATSMSSDRATSGRRNFQITPS